MRSSANKWHQQQYGAALITALFIVALVAAIATAMAFRQRIAIAQTSQILTADQAYQYAQAVPAWAIGALAMDIKRHRPEGLIDSFPMVWPTTQVGNAKIRGDIIDLQGRFNVNNLEDPSYIVNFTRLIMAVDSKIKEEEARTIAENAALWVSQTSSQNQANDPYLKAIPAYRMAHRYMTSPSELRLIFGVTPSIYTRLAPYITALPNPPTPINVNTASAPVLASLGIPINAAQTVVAYARKHPFPDNTTFADFPQVRQYRISGATTVLSNYFLARADVRMGSQHLLLYSVIQRGTVPQPSSANGGGQNDSTLPNLTNQSVKVLFESIGTW